jgi:prepilin-type N-terminal cleavage/methylation domain-containing protein
MLPAKHKRSMPVRGGFTLMELLVVLLIILILTSLVAAAVAYGLATGKRTRNRTEIAQLEEAVEQFKQRFGAYPPSRIMLCETTTISPATGYTPQSPDDGYNALRADSQAFLSKMFPRIDWSGSTAFDWSGDGTRTNPAVILEGDECLVFFLGGIANQFRLYDASGNLTGKQVPACQGFAPNPKDPTNFSTGGTPIGPFFEFANNRLVYFTHVASSFPTGSTTYATGQPGASANVRPATPYYLSYLDNYGLSDGLGTISSGAPYAFFSSYKARNGYNRYGFTLSDCPTLGTNFGGSGLWPYVQSGPTGAAPSAPVQYLKPTTFQIVSAGVDFTFGPGGVPQAGGSFVYWTPSTAGSVYPSGSAGFDDQSNFTGSTLGVGQD